MHVDFIVSTEPSGLSNKQPDPKYVQIFQQAKGKKTEKNVFLPVTDRTGFCIREERGKQDNSRT